MSLPKVLFESWVQKHPIIIGKPLPVIGQYKKKYSISAPTASCVHATFTCGPMRSCLFTQLQAILNSSSPSAYRTWLLLRIFAFGDIDDAKSLFKGEEMCDDAYHTYLTTECLCYVYIVVATRSKLKPHPTTAILCVSTNAACFCKHCTDTPYC